MKALHSLFLLLALTLLAACASTPGKPVPHAIAAKSGILIVYGYGMIPVYADPTPMTAAFHLSSQFVQELDHFLHTNRAPTWRKERWDKNVDIHSIVPQHLAEHREDALIQVSIQHDKNAQDNRLYLEARYNPLVWKVMADGQEQVDVLEGLAVEYTLGSDKPGFQQPRLSDIADNFTRRLYKAGYLQKKP